MLEVVADLTRLVAVVLDAVVVVVVVFVVVFMVVIVFVVADVARAAVAVGVSVDERGVAAVARCPVDAPT